MNVKQRYGNGIFTVQESDVKDILDVIAKVIKIRILGVSETNPTKKIIIVGHQTI